MRLCTHSLPDPSTQILESVFLNDQTTCNNKSVDPFTSIQNPNWIFFSSSEFWVQINFPRKTLTRFICIHPSNWWCSFREHKIRTKSSHSSIVVFTSSAAIHSNSTNKRNEWLEEKTHKLWMKKEKWWWFVHSNENRRHYNAEYNIRCDLKKEHLIFHKAQWGECNKFSLYFHFHQKQKGFPLNSSKRIFNIDYLYLSPYYLQAVGIFIVTGTGTGINVKTMVYGPAETQDTSGSITAAGKT